MNYYVKVEHNVKLFVEDLSSECKNTILFIHGWPLNHNAYEYQSTLILHGAHDKICPFQFAEYMNKSIRNSKLVSLTQSGHGAFYEEKDKVNEEFVNFIKS